MDNHTDTLEGAGPFLAPILARAETDAPFAMLRTEGTWQDVSLAELVGRANQFANLFVDAGIPQSAVVFIVQRHGVDMYAAFLGAMIAGLVPSYLPPPNIKQRDDVYWQQQEATLRHLEASYLCTTPELAPIFSEKLGDLALKVLTSDDADDFARVAKPCRRTPDAVALLQHSSGTTGQKKSVALSSRSITRQLASYSDSLGLGTITSPCIASWLPLYHDMGLISSFLLPIWSGIPIVSICPFEWVSSPTILLEGIARGRATHAWMPNFAFLHLARTTRPGDVYDLRSIRALISCSEPCKPRAFDIFGERFAELGISPDRLQTCYAMAETVFAVTQSEVGMPPRRLTISRECLQYFGPVRPPAEGVEGVSLLSNGRPIAGCEVAVLRDGKFVDELETGEICIRSDFMFSGYHKNDAATRKAFHGDWYKTGDIGFLERGELFITGRIKDIIIVNGKNIYAHDVEAAIQGIPGLKMGRAVAFGHYNETIGSEMLVLVAEREEATSNVQGLKTAINQAVLRAVGIPCSDIKIVDPGWLIKTTSGKISRSENARQYEVAKYNR